MKLIYAAVIASICFIASPAMAQRIGPRFPTTKLGTVINNQTLATTRSFTVTNEALGMGLLVLYIDTSNNGGLSQVSLACTLSDDDNATPFTLESCAVSAGVCTSSAASFVKAITTTPQRWAWKIDIMGNAGDLSCTFTPSGGDASDFITVDAQFVTQ